MKKKIMIIGANEYQDQLVRKANEMGIETHVFAWKEGAVARNNANFFYPISIRNINEILEIAKRIEPDGIATAGSDLAVVSVNEIALELGLFGNDQRSTDLTTNKFKMREALRSSGLPCPSFQLIVSREEMDTLGLSYPLIIKPTDRSGSRGVSLVQGPDELGNAYENAMSFSFNDQIIVEEFIVGKEYSVEMISYQGKHHFLEVTEKWTTGPPNFIETMHLEPSDLSDPKIEEVIELTISALDQLGIENGASHTEIKVDDSGKIWFIEIAGRMGGDFIGSDLIQNSTGIDNLANIIRVALGEEPEFPDNRLKRATLVKFIFNEKDKKVLDGLKKDYAGLLVRYELEDKELIDQKISHSAQRSGYFIITGNSRDECLGLIERCSI